MNIAQIEENLQKLLKSFKKETFIYDLLLAYGSPKASVTRLQKGSLNMSKVFGEVSWKQKVFFKELEAEDLHAVAKEMYKGLKHKQRFVITTDYTTLVAIDTKTGDKLDIELKELPKHFDFFLPWAGMEKAQYKDENPADVKAAEKMAKLYDAIRKDNPDDSPEFAHGLNVFLSRLLFCFFADDTGIFKDNQVTNAIASHTQSDGSDLDTYLAQLFEVLDTEEKERKNLPAHLASFPYVNGSLFSQRLVIPKFSRRSRQAILDSGEMDWSDINPDIFGSMFQAVIATDQRSSLGQHYTSVPNIMKVIEPLFLDELYEAFEKAKGDKTKLGLLLQRLRNIKIFDPACGSGNFLIIAYKELRRLEMKIFRETKELPFSGIQLSQFYGIELDDFAHEIAQLALWLAEHQMNLESFKAFGQANATLPLGDAGQITQGNACRLDWEVVCPKGKEDEIYILGNPPYLGKKEQTKEQKDELYSVCFSLSGHKNLDYIAIWFYLASRFCKKNNKIRAAFVSTNSICQGEQVGVLWPAIFSQGIEIQFAHSSFMWKNSAKYNAGVAVVIIGISNKSSQLKRLYTAENIIVTSEISPYLSTGSSTVVFKRSKTLSRIPKMTNGSMANDGGHFFLTEEEYKSLSDDLKPFFRKIIGARELFYSINRYVLWLEATNYKEAIKHDLINVRLERVKSYRLESNREATRKLAMFPHLFGEIRHKNGEALIVPGLSAERREYIPVDFVSKGEIVSNLAQVIYECEPWLFSLLSSRINIVWVRATSGYFKKDLRFSPILSYNNMPVPILSLIRKEEITQCVFRILEEREKHSEKTLAQLYDPDKMPEGLREAHRLNDLAVERCYRSRPFESDEERLEYLFKLYEKMIAEEREKNTLFEQQKKQAKTTRKKKSDA